MKEWNTVYRHQLAIFQREKGMQVYYGIAILILGYLSPYFIHSLLTSTIMTVMTTAILIKPQLVDSFGLEKEQRTMESLLSTPIQNKQLLNGKSFFCFVFSTGFFGISFLGIVLFYKPQGTTLLIIVLGFVLTFLSICNLGVYASFTATNTAIANRRISLIVYPLNLILIILVSVLFMNHKFAIVLCVSGFVCFHVILGIIFRCLRAHRQRCEFYERLTICPDSARRHTSLHSPNSQVSAVLRHEARYFGTLHSLQLNYLLLIFSPAIFLCLLSYTNGRVNLNFAILIITLMMPRIPMNLVSYAIGGEKAYKTGESLLSTPLSFPAMLLGKSLLPILVSIVALISSSLLSLLAAALMHYLIDGTAVFHPYSTAQLILVYPVTMLSCTLMIFLTAIFSTIMRTPRYGLYVSTVVGSLFVLPIYIILFFTGDPLSWSIMYGAFLLFCNIGCLVVLASSKVCTLRNMFQS